MKKEAPKRITLKTAFTPEKIKKALTESWNDQVKLMKKFGLL